MQTQPRTAQSNVVGSSGVRMALHRYLELGQHGQAFTQCINQSLDMGHLGRA
jgi:hypothetical protein